jgi:hypothetical protein
VKRSSIAFGVSIDVEGIVLRDRTVFLSALARVKSLATFLVLRRSKRSWSREKSKKRAVDDGPDAHHAVPCRAMHPSNDTLSTYSSSSSPYTAVCVHVIRSFARSSTCSRPLYDSITSTFRRWRWRPRLTALYLATTGTRLDHAAV